MDTYNERTGGNYFSLSNQENLNSCYWVHTPNTINTNKKLEFRFYRKVNSIGISDKEISQKKEDKTRIIALGDSFTEGVGTSYKDSWVKQMENRWNRKGVETINAGIGGSDPVYEFILYRDKLIKYDPDILILTINSSDIADIKSRGGFERFHSDGTAGSKPPSWEWVYAANHLFRTLIHNAFGYDSSLSKTPNSSDQNSVRIIKEALLRFKKLAAANDTELLIVLQPCIQEFNNGRHTPFFGQLKLVEFMKANEFKYLDASLVFKKQQKSIGDYYYYYYPIDTHFNKKGYKLFGTSVSEKVEELGFLN
ncbi:MAG: lysophospholipase L1-like esterase [Flavobacteriaceae bacterium]|jgi:lysophospholipase L1-like esterase